MSYTTRNGDTFEDISRNVYGVPTEAQRLRDANPGAAEPFPAGVVLVTPIEGESQPLGTAATEQNEVSVLINGAAWRRWESITVTRRLDSLDTYELTAPFEPADESFRDAFEPFGFQLVVISVGGLPLFTGRQLSPTPSTSSDRRTVTAVGYSLPGVLGDCTAPASSFPLASSGLNLQIVATKLAAPFGVPVIFEGPAGAAFDQVELKPTEPVLPFLVRLAKQRGLVVGNNTAGALVFRKPSGGVPVARLTEGLAPLLSVSPQFDPQAYYSDVTGIEPAGIGNAGGQQSTVKNPFSAGSLRPRTIELPDTSAGDIPAGTEAAFGRMLAGAASYTAEVSTWRNQTGGLWEPGEIVTVEAPGAMIYEPYDFLVREVTFRRADTATLTLCLPGVFSGETPEALPWRP